MLRIAMDSAGDMPDGWAETYDIQVIPINIHFGERMYLQGVDLSNADFYRMADESGVIPQTSQPTPQQFIDFYRKVARAGDLILSLHVTGKLSGTFDSAVMAARELAGELEKVSITLQMKVGEEDKLFGSVTGQMIADALKEKGFEIDKRHIDLEEPIKALGIYTVNIKLPHSVTGKVKVWVVRE